MLESVKNNWSTRELERQINSLLFERLVLSKDRERVLEFYNYILKCFMFIDLRVGKLTHQDIGQMDFYVRYFENEWRLVGDNPSIGLILCSDEKETLEKIYSLAMRKILSGHGKNSRRRLKELRLSKRGI